MRKVMMRGWLTYIAALLFCWAPFAGAADLAGMQIHGFVSQGYFRSVDNNFYAMETEDGSLEFNELGFTVSKNVTDNLRVGMQLLSRDYGKTGNNEVEIDWAFGDYRWRNWLGIYGGLMRMPHGLYNESRDQDLVRTSVLLPQSVYPELVRDYYTKRWGVGIYGTISTDTAGYLFYQMMVGTYNPDPENSGINTMISDGGYMTVEKFNHKTQYAGSLIWETPLSGLRVGATAWIIGDAVSDVHFEQDFITVSAGTTSPMGIKRWSTVYSIEYVRQNLKLAAEYRKEHTESEWLELNIPGVTSWETDTEGYYVSASYRFTDWLELGTYYSVFYPDSDDRGGENFKAFGMDDFWAWQKDLALSLRFDINEYWLMKIEGHHLDGTADALQGDNPDGVEKNDFLFAAKMTFSF